MQHNWIHIHSFLSITTASHHCSITSHIDMSYHQPIILSNSSIHHTSSYHHYHHFTMILIQLCPLPMSAPTSVIVCGSLCTYYYRLHMNRSICVHYMCHTTTLPSQEQSNQGSNDVISAPLPLIAIEILPQMMDSGGESSMINFSQLIWFVVSWPSLTLR